MSTNQAKIKIEAIIIGDRRINHTISIPKAMMCRKQSVGEEFLVKQYGSREFSRFDEITVEEAAKEAA